MVQYTTMKNCLISLALIVSLVGCTKKDEAEARKSRSGYDSLPDSAVLLQVNESQLTKGEFERQSRLMVELGKLGAPKANSNQVARYTQMMREYCCRRFVTRELCLNEARRAELKVADEQDVIAVSNNFLQLTGLLGKSFTELKAKLSPELVPLLDERLRLDALVQSYFKRKGGKELEVTEKEWQDYVDYIKRMKAWSKAEYDKAMKLGNELVDRFHKGEDFGKLADEYSIAVKQQRDGEGGLWGEYMPGTLLDENVRAAVKKTAVGDCTKPLDTPEGLFIVLVEKRTGSGEVTAVNMNPESLVLRRIVLRLPMLYEQMSRERFDRQCAMEKYQKFQEGLLKKLSDKAKISYPYGTNFWQQVDFPKSVK